MKVLAPGRQSATEADDENSEEGEGRGKKRRRRGSGVISCQEGEADRYRISAQVRLTGKAMRMRAQGEGMVVSEEEEKFDDENGHVDVKLEPDGNLVLDGVSSLVWGVSKHFLSLGAVGKNSKVESGRREGIPWKYEGWMGSDLPLLQ